MSFQATDLDRELLARLERPARLARLALRRARPLARPARIGVYAKLEPIGSRVGSGRERELPDDLWGWLAEQVPQALLRDLHRPVTAFYVSALDLIETGRDPGARAAGRLFRDDRFHLRPRFDRSALAALDAQRRGHRELLDHEWTKGPPKGPVRDWMPFEPEVMERF